MSHDTNRVKNKILNDEDRLSKEPDLSLKKSVRSNSLILNGLRSHFFKFSALTSLASIILLSGCSSAGPHLVNGEYYYGGDSECVSYRQTATQRSNGEISCYNSSGQYTGTRTALSLEEVQQYQQQQMSNVLHMNFSSDYSKEKLEETFAKCEKCDYETKVNLIGLFNRSVRSKC